MTRVVLKYTDLNLIKMGYFLSDAPYFYIDLTRSIGEDGVEKYSFNPRHLPGEDWQVETLEVFQEQRWFDPCPEKIKKPLYGAMLAISTLIKDRSGQKP